MITVKPATLKDAPRIRDLVARNLPDYPLKLKEIHSSIKAKHHLVLTAQHGKKLVAVALLTGDVGDKAWLYHISVAEPYREVGLGGILLGLVEDYAKDTGYSKIELASDKGQKKWYKKRGYKVICLYENLDHMGKKL